ncbi:hypothetical protein DACRYDRAFT_116451 [Dacryopinax primogenitus]|uniref:Zn(2)-C6 fungal-type domain-containing protein n=1 Tax=Dacryopinax primogenitus (strain DJM 731) TaxID=1858805 RepID=M5FU65_DACPD|nr:uncharacterized protein DACRYDRAFT_116451 [Dacryopinax primogenitus]EJU01236.1 hypothetical protein DACRYDRAFT_116451 [Dacryopinax primogenitus]
MPVGGTPGLPASAPQGAQYPVLVLPLFAAYSHGWNVQPQAAAPVVVPAEQPYTGQEQAHTPETSVKLRSNACQRCYKAHHRCGRKLPVCGKFAQSRSPCDDPKPSEDRKQLQRVERKHTSTSDSVASALKQPMNESDRGNSENVCGPDSESEIPVEMRDFERETLEHESPGEDINREDLQVPQINICDVSMSDEWAKTQQEETPGNIPAATGAALSALCEVIGISSEDATEPPCH